MTSVTGTSHPDVGAPAARIRAPEGLGRLGRLGRLAPLLVPVVVIVVMGWARRWVFEDAFLNFRIVDQIRAGHGPVFNAGQRVETATSTLWLGTLVVLRTLLPFVRIERSAVFVGLVGSAAGVGMAQLGAARLWGRSVVGGSTAPVMVPFGMLVYVALPPSWDWATSGLENGLTLAWLGALMLLLGTLADREADTGPVGAAGPTNRRLVGIGVLVGLGPLIRPDLTIISVVTVIAVCWIVRPRGRRLAALLGGFVALPALFEVFRIGYYGTLVPNTALAKDASGAYWSQGWNYLVDLVVPYRLFVPAVVVVGTVVVFTMRAQARPAWVAAIALPVGGVLHGLYMVETGGDYLHARLLLPALFAVLAPVAALPWRRWLLAPVALVGLWAVVAAGWLRPAVHETFVPLTEYGVADGRLVMEGLTKPGHRPLLATDFAATDGPLALRLQREGRRDLVRWISPRPLRDVTPERTTLISTTAGISGYLAGPDVLVQEANALGDPVGSRMPAIRPSTPGHRKRESDPWMIAMTTRPGVTAGSPPELVAAARRALGCGDLAQLLTAVGAELTPSRFVRNALGAIGRTNLVVPRDPVAAEQRFCERSG